MIADTDVLIDYLKGKDPAYAWVTTGLENGPCARR